MTLRMPDMRRRAILTVLLMCIIVPFAGCGGGGDGGNNGPTGPFACSPRFGTLTTWIVSVCGGGGIGRTGSATPTLNTSSCTMNMRLEQGEYLGLLTVNFNEGTATLENRVNQCGGTDQGTIRTAAGASVIIDMRNTPQQGCCTSGYVINLTPSGQ